MNPETKICQNPDAPVGAPTSQGERRSCQNCKKDFTVEPEDFAFYEKISVPPPTWCPECRHVRRIVWFFGRNAFWRTCDAPGHSERILSRYPASSTLKVYDQEYWWSDAWDPMNYGFAWDTGKTFLAQLGELIQKVPVKNVQVINSPNCEYCLSVTDCKNCYFVSGGGFQSENCMYSETPVMSQSVVDSWVAMGSDTLYECFACNRSSHLNYSAHCEECLNSSFLYNCKGCSDCFGCVGLRHKQFYIWNKPLTREKYDEEIAKLDLTSAAAVAELKSRFRQFRLRFPHRYADIVRSENCTGDIINNSRNCQECFEIREGAENCKYVLLAGMGVKDSMDVTGGGLKSELLYETNNVVAGQKVLFSARVRQSMDIMYSAECYTSAHLFGCVGLRNKQYCILNRQYTKEDYEALVPKIIANMSDIPFVDPRGVVYKFGEFLPPSLLPYGYNHSSGNEYFHLSKEKALRAGYAWGEPEERTHNITLKAIDLPDRTSDAPDSITSEIIACAHEGECDEECAVAYRIIPAELEFYRANKLPLPRLCPNCRHFQRFRQNRFHSKSAVALFERVCQCGSDIGGQTSEVGYRNTAVHFHGDKPCPNKFQTPYAPDQPEIVYCEQCYIAEIA